MRDTIDMAREAGAHRSHNPELWDIWEISDKALKAFEALVRADERNRTWTQEHWTEYERSIAAAEREACAKVCDDWPNGRDDVYSIAVAIRARGEK